MNTLFQKIAVGFILFVFGSGTVAFAGTGEWTVSLTVSTPFSAVPGGVVSIPMAAGVRNGATPGYDTAMDTVSFLEPDDPLLAHFLHGALLQEDTGGGITGWNCPEPEVGYNAYQCSLWRDFRALSDSMSWSFEVISPLNGATVSIDWKMEGDPEDLSKLDLILVDRDTAFSPPLPPQLNQPSHYEYTNFLLTGKKYGSRHFEIRMKTTGLFLSPATLHPGTLNTPYTEFLHLIGGAAMWSLTQGDLPPGLRLDASSGVIDGVPIQEGSFTFTVSADDPVHHQSPGKEYTLFINPALAITTTQLPSGEVYSSYSETLRAAGGTLPYSFSLISGSLPEGLILDKTQGILSGSFQLPGLFDFTIQAEDSAGARASQSYRVTVTEPADTQSPSTVSDLRILYTTPTAAVLSWTAPWDDGLTRTAAAYDLRYSTSCPGNVDETWWEAALQASGEPRPVSGVLHTYTLSGLDPNQTYCAALRSVDASGHLAGISNVVTFPDGIPTGSGESAGTVTRQYLLREGYNLISVPLIPLPNDISQFQDDVGASPALYRWHSVYPQPPQWYLESSVQPGYGYFLYAPTTGMTLDITGLPVADAQISIPVQSGWNMVGNPYETDLLLENVVIREITETGPGEAKTFEEAARSGWVGNALYAFNGLGYEFLAVNDTPPAVLTPGMGFWLHVPENRNYEMIFRKP